jgi:3-hydroxy-3-methylglutaryl CoA synthase
VNGNIRLRLQEQPKRNKKERRSKLAGGGEEEAEGRVKRGRISAQGSDDRKFAHRDRERVTAAAAAAAAVIQKESPVRDEMSLLLVSARWQRIDDHLRLNQDDDAAIAR